VEQLLQSNSENVVNEPVSNLVEDSNPAEIAMDENQNSENQVPENIPAEIPQNLAEIPDSQIAAEIPQAIQQSIQQSNQEQVQQIEPKQQQFEAVQQQFDPVQAGPSEPAQVAQIAPENVVTEKPAPADPKKEEDEEVLSDFDKKELEALDAAFAKFNSGASAEALPDVSKEGAMDAQAKMWEDYYKLHPEMRPAEEEKPVEIEVQNVVNPVADSFMAAQQPVQQYQQPVQQYQQPVQQEVQQHVQYQQPIQQYQQQDQQVVQQYQQPAQEQYQQPVQQYQQPQQVPQQYVQQAVQYQQPAAQQYVQQPAVPQYIPQ